MQGETLVGKNVKYIERIGHSLSLKCYNQFKNARGIIQLGIKTSIRTVRFKNKEIEIEFKVYNGRREGEGGGLKKT